MKSPDIPGRFRGSSVVRYTSALPRVDLRYQVSGNAVKEELVLSSRRAPKSFTFDIVDPDHSLGEVRKTPGGGYSFSGSVAEDTVMTIAPAMAKAAGGEYNPNIATASQRLTRTSDGYRLVVRLDPTWLRTARYPVTLDPTIQYSFDEGTLASAWAPISDTACSGEPCPLFSEADGSVYIDQSNSQCLDPVTNAYFHTNLSNIPAWTTIDNATFSLEYDPDDVEFNVPWKEIELRPAGAFYEPGDTWNSGDPMDDAIEYGSFYYPDYPFGMNAAGRKQLTYDVSSFVKETVSRGIGAQAGLLYSPPCIVFRSAAGAGADREGHRSSPSLNDNNFWLYNPKLEIEYTGDPLPPPLPVEQTYGCDCRWFRGPEVVNRVADPINTAAGQMTEQFNDLYVASRGMPVTFARTYNGGDDDTGTLGPGWTHQYETSLSEDSATGDITFKDPTGGVMTYIATLDGYVGTAGAVGTLTRDPGSAANAGWTLSSPTGDQMHFDSSGRLDEMSDDLGHAITLTRTGSNPPGPTSVTDAAGRGLELTYGTAGAAAGKLTEVETTDGRTVTFGYQNVAGASRLTSVTDPESRHTTISYDTTSGQLSGIEEPDGTHRALNTFDPATGRITEQEDQTGAVTTMSWKPITAPGMPAGTGTQKTTDANGDTTTDLYYGHVLLRHRDAAGLTTKYTYDEHLNLVALTDPIGNVTTYTYDNQGRMLSQTGPAPSSITETWTYDTGGRTASHTDGNGNTTAYDYNSAGDLTSTTDPLGHTATFGYDSQHQLTTITSAEDRTTHVTYNTAGRPLSRTDAEGGQTTFAYDAAGNLISQTDPRGNEPGADPDDFTTTYTYDDLGRVLTSTTPDGTVTSSVYDANGAVASSTVTNAFNVVLSEVENTYDDAGRLLTVTTSGTLTTTNTYDAIGNLASTTDGEGNTTTYAYEDGRLASTVSPRGNEPGAYASDFTTTYTYDDAGRRRSTNTPDGGSTLDLYDENGRTIEHRSPSGRNITKNTYDDAGNVVAVEDALGHVTTRTYDDANRLIGEQRPGMASTTITYDDDNLRTAVTSPSGEMTQKWTHDLNGRVVTATKPAGVATAAAHDYEQSFDYDAAGNLTAVTDERGEETQFTYDARGNRLTATDANSHTTSWTYDGLNRLTAVTTPGNATTAYTYDARGNLTAVIDAKQHATTYTYDDANRQTSSTDALGRTRLQHYDAAGNMTSWTTARGTAPGATAADYTVTQTFNHNNQVTSRTTSDADEDQSFGYDYDGLLEYTYDQLGVTYYTYDDAGQLTGLELGSAAQPTPSTFAYTYQPNGQIASRTYPSGITSNYTYNADGQLESDETLTDDPTTYAYDPNGDLDTIAYPSGADLTEVWDRDPAGNITRVSAERSGSAPTGGTSMVSSTDYTFDAVGNPLTKTTTRGATTVDTRTYEYDARNRLTKECTGATGCGIGLSGTSYSYDAVGNRTASTPIGVSVTDPSVTYQYDAANQLTTTTTTTALDSTTTTSTYDADGQLTTGGRQYNALGQLTAANPTGNAAVTFKRDALGNLREVDDNGTTRTLTWDINNPLPMVAEISSAAGTSSQHYTPDGLPLFGRDASTFDNTYYSHDALGSITGTFDTGGQHVVATTYDAFGQADDLPLIQGATRGPFGFTGALDLTETSNVHLRARDYDPATGTFTTTDPAPVGVGTPTTSTYGYVNNQPTRYTDPSGRCTKKLNWLCDVADVTTSVASLANPIAGLVNECEGLRRYTCDAAVFAIDHDPVLNLAYEISPGAFETVGGGITSFFNGFTFGAVEDVAESMDPGAGDIASDLSDAHPWCFRLGVVAGVVDLAYAAGRGGIAGLRGLRNLFGGGGERISVNVGARTSHGPGAKSASEPRWPKPNAGNNNCTQCAIKIEKLIGGERKVITGGSAPRLGPSVRDPQGLWYYHEVVVKNGRVYDAFTGPNGLSIPEFKAQFDEAAYIHFGF